MFNLFYWNKSVNVQQYTVKESVNLQQYTVKESVNLQQYTVKESVQVLPAEAVPWARSPGNVPFEGPSDAPFEDPFGGPKSAAMQHRIQQRWIGT